MIAPPGGGAPAALTNLPGTGPGFGGAASLAGYALGVLSGQSALFTTEPLADPLTLVGSARVDVEVTSTRSTATLFASLWDLGPDIERTQNGRTTTGPSSAVLPQLAVAPVRLTGLKPGEPTPVAIALPAVSHQVPLDHRLQLVISSTDQAYALPKESAVYQIDLSGDRTLALPQLELTPVDTTALDVPLALVIVVGLLIAAAVAAVILFRRRQRAAVPNPTWPTCRWWSTASSRPTEAGSRLSLVSRSGRSRQGRRPAGSERRRQDHGDRMLVGLIRPDAGRIFVHGEPVHGGADVLGSVGAFIEGRLPAAPDGTAEPARLLGRHRSAAGRSPPGGGAGHRRVGVGAGSQGPRLQPRHAAAAGHRPGDARAAVTAGARRTDQRAGPAADQGDAGGVADYAAAGRTVVISSHLLSEVEHTCSHVVVMDQGRWC